MAATVACAVVSFCPNAHSVPLAINVQTVTLPNGLRVVLSPDDASPTVAIAVYYNVGSRDEEQHRSGFAHLFEHMMFEGSGNAPKGLFDRLMDRNGNSDANGTTSEDRTNYYETLPSNALSVGLWLEADRMRALAVTAESFENQRAVVLEERRQSYENQAYGMAQLRRDALAYGSYYPYAHTAIGEPEDLNAATFEDVRAFHQRYYVPNNAVLSIAGRMDTASTIALIRQYWSAVPRGAEPVRPAMTSTTPAPITQPITETMTDSLATLPGQWVVYRIPPRRHPDVYALELLAAILGEGESSRLYRLMVHEREVASTVEVSADVRRGEGLFALWTIAARGKTTENTLSTMDTALQSVRTSGVTEDELTAAKNRFRAQYLFALESNAVRARTIAEHYLYDGDATLIRTELDRYLAVTVDQVRTVAQTYLDPAHRVVLNVQPPGAAIRPAGRPAGRGGAR